MIFYADGLCEPTNPNGYACWGWVALDEHRNRVADDCGCVGHGDGMTNNVAEYWAAINALLWAVNNGLTGVTLRTDSKLVVEQANGRWAVRSAQLAPLVDLLRHCLKHVGGTIEWVPREQNTIADALSRKAYKAATRPGL